MELSKIREALDKVPYTLYPVRHKQWHRWCGMPALEIQTNKGLDADARLVSELGYGAIPYLSKKPDAVLEEVIKPYLVRDYIFHKFPAAGDFFLFPTLGEAREEEIMLHMAISMAEFDEQFYTKMLDYIGSMITEKNLTTQ